MRKCIKEWRHKKNEDSWKPFLKCLAKGAISDDEYKHIKDNSSDNFSQSDAYFDSARRCINKIHNEKNIPSFNEDELKINDAFLDGSGEYKYGSNKKINFITFADRLLQYPMSDELFERIKQSNNTTTDFDDASTSNTIMQAKLMVDIVKEIRNNKEYKSMEKKDMEQEFSEWLKKQTTQQENLFSDVQVKNLCKDLKETIPNWNEVHYENLFNIVDIEVINELYKRCLRGGDLKELCLNVGNNRPSNALKRYEEFLKNRESSNQSKLKEVIDLLKCKKQIILQGSPGTGKTHKAMEIAKEMAPNNYKLIQFHPAYTYEDFVRGIVATTDDNGNINYEVKNKVLVEMAENAENAKNNPDNPFVLIIDEINRANLSSVLGELIYALEYRGKVVEGMYGYKESKESKESRGIVLPENLYIIGTMNTADRSVGHIDYAIRRRFAFVDVNTDESVISNKAKPLFKKVKGLFKEHLSDEFELNDVMIGHSYFLRDNLKLALEYEIKPMLQEYRKDGVLTCEKEKIEELKIEG
ncbi:hypothetical protein [uncultured Gammaproteobacteria bacterium]|jgi:DNA replication protein DnaC|nr:hypothetical protein [uncultured Gammaproteobacteria bacterium]